MRISTIFLTLFLVLPEVTVAEGSERLIVVQGESVVSAEPDMAVINLGVTRQARTASKAMAATSAGMFEVLTSLKSAGLEDRDVQTSSISLSPRWDRPKNGQPVVNGYIASNSLNVRVRDLDQLGGILDAVVGNGANSMNGLSFSIAEPRPLQDKSRSDAVNDARAKAELLAGAAGVELGQVILISEAGSFAPPTPMMRGAMMEQSMAAPLATGEIDIRMSVSMTFAIAN